MLAIPAAVPAYVGPPTWHDQGWRCCRICDVEWGGDTGCFVNSAHPGVPGRLGSWCRHGLRLVEGAGADVCPHCERHDPSDYTAEFMEAFSLAADRVLQRT